MEKNKLHDAIDKDILSALQKLSKQQEEVHPDYFNLSLFEQVNLYGKEWIKKQEVIFNKVQEESKCDTLV